MDSNGRQVDRVADGSAPLRFNPNSRLVIRGSRAIKAFREVSIPVEDFHIAKPGLVVRSADWDEDSSTFGSRLNAGAPRQLNFYVFARDGRFQKRIECRLVRFNLEAYSRVLHRQIVTLSILDHRVHFAEEFTIAPHREIVRVDYLFDLNGERLSLWCNSTFIDKYSVGDEPHCPVTSWCMPSWVLSDHLVAMNGSVTWKNFSSYVAPSSMHCYLQVFTLSTLLDRVEHAWHYEAIFGRTISFVGLVPTQPDWPSIDTLVTAYAGKSGDFYDVFKKAHVSNAAVWVVDEYRYTPTNSLRWLVNVLRFQDGRPHWQRFPLDGIAEVWLALTQPASRKRQRPKQGSDTTFKQMPLLSNDKAPSIRVKQIFGDESGSVVLVVGEEGSQLDATLLYEEVEMELRFQRGVSRDDFSRRVDMAASSYGKEFRTQSWKHCSLIDGVLASVVYDDLKSPLMVLTNMENFNMEIREPTVLDIELSDLLRPTIGS